MLDLINDSLPGDSIGGQRLRLRSEFRKLRPPLVDRHGILTRPPYDLSEALAKMYLVSEATYWPAAQLCEQGFGCYIQTDESAIPLRQCGRHR